ncbi:VCBS repeat-containing protein [Flavivirga abyssicola]|uniref:FG-GAP repeat domain-containing protein n=1 Tax=Flavivirga abyssicola TaxID=3063533 RepID=UPI0026DFA7DD|nr:VCBS repeat-containing protein [Flavivirga sp. MEBiC07777]WVK14152.1 VCBS repeat-containing protein [Flavivirga sp. MEBiC07777]
MKKTILITTFTLCVITIQSCAQSTKEHNTNLVSVSNTTTTPNEFPELIQADIPGAPKLGNPQLIMGASKPVMGEGMGWAAPAIYDWDDDGKKDLLIGEFASGLESKLGPVGNFVRVYQNIGTDSLPEFNDQFNYARAIDDLETSSGTPLSVYTWCCLAFTPRFEDLDNDGFTDLLTGQFNPGYITWFRGSDEGFLPGIKLEEIYNPLIGYKSREYSLPMTDPKGASYWTYSAAAFGDFDTDGDLDMIIGGAGLRFSENLGTKSAPKFGKRKQLKGLDGKPLDSSVLSGTLTVPYVVDWNGDGVLDILLTGHYSEAGHAAVTFYQGVKISEEFQFKAGIPLFTAKDGEKAFPGSWLNVSVADWNNDGVNDLLIGTSVATLNGEFNHKLSWQWEIDTGISKLNPAYDSASMKSTIAQQIEGAEAFQKKSGLNDEEWDSKPNQSSKRRLIKHYYGNDGYKNKDLAHQGYVYVMLGTKKDQ